MRQKIAMRLRALNPGNRLSAPSHPAGRMEANRKARAEITAIPWLQGAPFSPRHRRPGNRGSGVHGGKHQRGSDMFAGKDINYSAATIHNDGFWPDVAVADFERRRACLPIWTSRPPAPPCWPPSLKSTCSSPAIRQRFAGQGLHHCRQVPGPSLEGDNNALTEQYLAAVFAPRQGRLAAGFAQRHRTGHRQQPGGAIPDQRAQLLAEASSWCAASGKAPGGVSLI